MLGFKDLIEELRAEFDKLEHGVSTGHVREAKADAEQVAHDAETAAAPVVAEAEHDAEHLAGEAATDVAHSAEAPKTA